MKTSFRTRTRIYNRKLSVAILWFSYKLYILVCINDIENEPKEMKKKKKTLGKLHKTLLGQKVLINGR